MSPRWLASIASIAFGLAAIAAAIGYLDHATVSRILMVVGFSVASASWTFVALTGRFRRRD